jgi:predicted dehydrogenase
VDLVAVCGRTAPKTEALALAHGVPARRSVEELIQNDAPDVVCVCTGNDQHLEPTLECLEGGANVFVEKPMAFRLDQARRMVAAADRKGLTLGVDFNHRFSEPYRRARRFVDEGALGAIGFIDMKFAGDLYKELNDPYCMLIETQGHSFDLLRLFGGEITTLSAHLADPRGIGVYTSAAVAVTFAGGGVGSLLGSWDGSYGHPGAQVFEVAGVGGRAVVEDVVGSVRLFTQSDHLFSEWSPGLFDSDARDFWRTIDTHLHAFVDSILAGREPPVSGRDGLRALELCYAAIASFERGLTVSVESTL